MLPADFDVETLNPPVDFVERVEDRLLPEQATKAIAEEMKYPSFQADSYNWSTAQRTFDTIVQHLRQQNRKSTNQHGDCLYRAKAGDNQLSCAAGCLIPDEYYREWMENQNAGCTISDHTVTLDKYEHAMERMTEQGDFVSVDATIEHVLSRRVYPTSVGVLINKLGYNIFVARIMQAVHDNCDVEDWEEQFRRVAHVLELEYTPPEKGKKK